MPERERSTDVRPDAFAALERIGASLATEARVRQALAMLAEEQRRSRRQLDEIVALRLDLEAEQNRYGETFDFAPVGYLVLEPVRLSSLLALVEASAD